MKTLTLTSCGELHPADPGRACELPAGHDGNHASRSPRDDRRERDARRQAAATQRLADATELQALAFMEPRYRDRVAKAHASDAWNAEAELVIVTGAIDALTTRIAHGAISRVAAAKTRRRLAAERRIAAEQEAAAHAASNAAIAAGNMPF